MNRFTLLGVATAAAAAAIALPAPAFAQASETPRIALAPRRPLFAVPSSSIMASSMATCSVASMPSSASAISPFTLAQASSTPLPP